MHSSVIDQIREHMTVVGSDGQHVGTVDRVQGDQIKLTKNDSPDGQHHLIPCSMVGAVDDRVHLTVSSQQATMSWQSA